MTSPDRPTVFDGAIISAGLTTLVGTIGVVLGAHPLASIWFGCLVAVLGTSAFERALDRVG